MGVTYDGQTDEDADGWTDGIDIIHMCQSATQEVKCVQNSCEPYYCLTGLYLFLCL